MKYKERLLYYDLISQVDPMNQQYYHGTSSALELDKVNVIEPYTTTGILREDRDYNLDKVYITNNYHSAAVYAEKATEKYGGEPVVYEVQPDEYSLEHRRDDEYITDFADIIRIA